MKLHKCTGLTLGLATLCSTLIFHSICSATTTIDDYDGTSIKGDSRIFGYGTVDISNKIVKSGSDSLKISPSGVGWGCVVIKEFNSVQDFSKCVSLSYWMQTTRSINAKDVKIALKLVFENGTEWLQIPNQRPNLESAINHWGKIDVPFSVENFAIKGPHGVDNPQLFTPRSISKIGIVVVSVQKAVNIYLDDLAFTSTEKSSPKTIVNAVSVNTQINKKIPSLEPRASFTGLIDDFVPPERYSDNHFNDVKISGTDTYGLTGTTETGTSPELNHVIATDGVLSLSWSKANVKWATELAKTGVDISSNNYLVLRMKSSNPFTKMSVVLLSSTGESESIVIPTKLIKTKYATINVPLTSLDKQSLSSVQSISLVFHDDSGSANVNQIGLSVCKRPNLIKLNFPGGTLINSGNNALIEILLVDEFGFPCSDFNSFIQLTVTNGFIHPNQISGFTNGKARGIFTITGYGNQQLIAKDIISGVTDND